MLGQSDIPVSFVDTVLRAHDKVEIIRGNLKGLQGVVIQVNEGKNEVFVRIEILGSAKITIDSVSLKRIV